MPTIVEEIASAAYRKYSTAPQTADVMMEIMLFWRREIISAGKQIGHDLTNDDFDVDCFLENDSECNIIIECKNDDKKIVFRALGFPMK